MLGWLNKKRGSTAIEIAAVAAVMALLMAMGVMLYRSMRQAARVSVAENNLKQVSTALELYFHRYGSYPPQGSNLAEVLAPFVENQSAFSNPLKDEDEPGATISALYQQPTVEELDSPDQYVTAMIADDGTTCVILKTGNKVERHDDIHFNPADPPEEILAVLNPEGEEEAGDDVGDQAQQPGDDGDDDQDAPPPDANPNQFTEENPAGVVTTKDCFDAVFQVAAVDLTWGQGGPAVPVVVHGTFARPVADGQEVDPDAEQINGKPAVTEAMFGGQPVQGGETEVRVVRNAESFTLEATASYGDWQVTYSSDEDLGQVLTLRNGDLPAEFDPYRNPVAIGPALQGLINPNTGSVTIGDNQVLYLFELGTENRDAVEYDLQDLIILVTLNEAADPSQCEDDAPPADDGGSGGTDESQEGFVVEDDGDVVTQMCSDVRIKAIGSQFGYADGTLVPVVASANMGNGWFDLFGGNPVKGGEEFTQQSVPAGTSVVIKGEIAGDYERWLWTQYGYPLSYTSNGGSGQVLTLKQGDTPVYFAPGFPSQAPVGELLAPYVDPQTGVVSIADNEALYLWDFNPLYTNYGIDFQDLIILATAVAAEHDCEENPTGGTGGGAAYPVLTLSPDNLTTDQTSFTVEVSNTATDAADIAQNVILQVQVVGGGQYVNTLACDVALGAIAAGETRQVPVTVNTNAAWDTAYGQSIELMVKVLNEDSAPETNEGKSISVTITGPAAPHPVLVLTPWGDGRNNRGHGNNADHDDEDNPGQGGGNHGAEPGYDDDGYDDDEMGGGCGHTNTRQYAFEIENTAPADNPATGVRVAFTILDGQQYVNRIIYDGNVGTINPGQKKYVSVRFYPKWRAWRRAPNGASVRVRCSIIAEDNDPATNVGKSAEVVFEK